jgi:hypothetical protein
MNDEGLKMLGFTDYDFIDEYMEKQKETLCNLFDNENLRAVLRNETLYSFLAEYFMYNLVDYSRTDNGQAVSIFLEDARCEVNICHLEVCLSEGLTTMAAVLEKDERVKKGITTCRTSYLLQQYRRLLLLHQQ